MTWTDQDIQESQTIAADAQRVAAAPDPQAARDDINRRGEEFIARMQEEGKR